MYTTPHGTRTRLCTEIEQRVENLNPAFNVVPVYHETDASKSKEKQQATNLFNAKHGQRSVDLADSY